MRDSSLISGIKKKMKVLTNVWRYCNFCSCLHDSLIRDRQALGIRKESIGKKLLQEKKLNFSHATDIARSGETTNMCLKELKKETPISGTDDKINAVTPKRTENNRPRRDKGIIRSCQYCRGRHRGDCPAYGQTCKKCGHHNHFPQVCQ